MEVFATGGAKAVTASYCLVEYDVQLVGAMTVLVLLEREESRHSAGC